MLTLHTVQVIVGLGNPDATYAGTRHNLGKRFVQEWSKACLVDWRKDRALNAYLGVEVRNPNPRYWILPETYMNLSGYPISAFMKRKGLSPSTLLVCHDDIEVPLGTWRYKEGGGHGGHNGLRDIGLKLGSLGFARLRLGIGRSMLPHQTVADFVLAKPDLEAQVRIDHMLSDLQSAVHSAEAIN